MVGWDSRYQVAKWNCNSRSRSGCQVVGFQEPSQVKLESKVKLSSKLDQESSHMKLEIKVKSQSEVVEQESRIKTSVLLEIKFSSYCQDTRSSYQIGQVRQTA